MSVCIVYMETRWFKSRHYEFSNLMEIPVENWKSIAVPTKIALQSIKNTKEGKTAQS